MKRSLMGSLALCVAMLAAFVIFGAFPEPVAAQEGGGQSVLNEENVQLPNDPDWKPEGPVPRMPDGKPDLSAPAPRSADGHAGQEARPEKGGGTF